MNSVPWCLTTVPVWKQVCLVVSASGRFLLMNVEVIDFVYDDGTVWAP